MALALQIEEENEMNDIEKSDQNDPMKIVEGLGTQFLSLVKEINVLSNKIINRPTSIEKVFSVSFYLDKPKIEFFYGLIAQKLKNNKIEDYQFEIGVHYNDDSYVPYDSLEKFLSENEAQPIYAQLLKMKWSGRIYFENKANQFREKIGEQHEIEVVFSLPPVESDDSDHVFFMFNEKSIEGHGVIQATISHSNKVWAVEVLQHISTFVDTIKIKNESKMRWFFKRRTVIGKLVEAAIDFSIMIPLIFAILALNGAYTSRYILSLVCLSGVLFVFSNMFSYSVGKALYKTLGRII
jgi:hypothetical protein